MPTLADVAKIAGVGVMSVSRVVNGTRKVSKDTEERVLEAIRRIGYEPNEAARMLKGHRARVLGLIVPDLADPFYAVLANAVQETAREAGYMTLLVASGHQVTVERQQVELMLQRQVSGLIVIPSGRDNDFYLHALKQKVPIVSVDRPLESIDVDSVMVNNREATVKAMKHLLEHGHRNILYLTDEEIILTKRERLAGYYDAIRKAKLHPQICVVGPTAGPARESLPALLASKPTITAIFASSDLLAIAALKELSRLKVQIPQQIALIGFDDFDAATLTTPTITVVAQPVVELGRKAVSLLLQRVVSGKTEDPAQVVLDTTFLIRESCGCGCEAKPSKRR
jgi:LacI family transcriptional regulator